MSITRQLSLMRQRGALDRDTHSVIARLARGALLLHKQLKADPTWKSTDLESVNSTGDRQTTQDILSHEILVRELSSLRVVSSIISEEADTASEGGSGKIGVSLDPFDGSHAFRLGIPAGTIFGLFHDCGIGNTFNGDNVFCSGFFSYGMQIELFLCVERKVFVVTATSTTQIDSIQEKDRYFCANLSNLSYWEDGWRDFFLRNVISPSPKNHRNTRWFGSLVTHARTVILSGGLFAYPPDNRKEYGGGHLRQVYEAIPISYMIESLGGRSTDGQESILTKKVTHLHQKTAFAFGEKIAIRELEISIQAHRVSQ